MTIAKAPLAARLSSAAGTGTGLYRPARLGAIRLGYLGSRRLLQVDGTTRTTNYDDTSWVIQERGRGQGATMGLKVFGFTPVVGQEIVFGAGTLRNRLFRGTITRVRQVRGKLNAGRVVYACQCLDVVYLLARFKVTKKYAAMSASAIAEDLMQTYADADAPAAPVSAVSADWKASTATGLTEGGVYSWKVSYVTATGSETLAGPASSNHTVPTPLAAPGGSALTNPRNGTTLTPRLTSGATYSYKATYRLSGGGETTVSAATAGFVSDGHEALIDHEILSDSRISHFLYRTLANGAVYFLVNGYSIVDADTYSDSATDAALTTTQPPVGNTAYRRAVSLTSLPVSGSASVVARRLYRTEAGGSTYKLVATVNDNLTTTYVDSTPDASLGATLPTVSSIVPFSTDHVQADLAVVDDIQFTMQSLPSALQQLAERIGGYWYVDADRDLHFFTSEAITGPQAITSANPHVRNFAFESDAEQVRNRILVEGKGSTVPLTTAVGSTAIPVQDAAMFSTGGGEAKLEAQRITYTGISSIGATAPASAPTVTVDSTSGTPIAQAWAVGDTVEFAYTYSWDAVDTDTGHESNFSPVSIAQTGVLFSPGFVKNYDVSGAYSTSPNVTRIHLWVRVNGGTWQSTQGAHTITNNTAGGTWSEVSLRRDASSSAPRYPRPSATPTLTGVPASGRGSVTSALVAGETINLLITAEDLPSQATYGIREEFAQDRRLSIDGATERAAAMLAILKDARASGSFASSDPNVHASRPLAIACTEWGLTASVTLQSVTLRPVKGRQHPLATEVQFSTRTIDDLFTQLREIREQLAR